MKGIFGVYVTTALRLIVIPVAILAALFGLKELANLLFGLSIDNTPLNFVMRKKT